MVPLGALLDQITGARFSLEGRESYANDTKLVWKVKLQAGKISLAEGLHLTRRRAGSWEQPQERRPGGRTPSKQKNGAAVDVKRKPSPLLKLKSHGDSSRDCNLSVTHRQAWGFAVLPACSSGGRGGPETRHPGVSLSLRTVCCVCELNQYQRWNREECTVMSADTTRS